MAETDQDPIEIYRARNLPEAHAIRLLMEANGIDISIWNESLQGIVGEVAMGWSTSPRLMVPRHDASRAEQLLAGFVGDASRAVQATSDDTLNCMACGAAMGSRIHCSACGWTYADDQQTKATLIETQPSIIALSGTDACDVLDTEAQPEDPNARREIWLEIGVVLCVGVVPNLANSLFSFARQPAVAPYWATSSVFAAYSLSTLIATLYIIHRSQEPWEYSGFRQVLPLDIALAIILTLVMRYVDGLIQIFLPSSGSSAYSPPNLPIDFILLPISSCSRLITATRDCQAWCTPLFLD